MNPDWKKKTEYTDDYKRIFRYNYVNKPVKLISEPQNKEDPNAIMVFVAGEHVGYVPTEDCLEVKRILDTTDVKYITSFIGGGD